MGMLAMPVDSFASERDRLMKDVLAHYAGKETMPAESVFKNLKVIKGRTVDQVLHMMNMGFGRSLGVRCQHCHVLGHWADEDKHTKQIARDLMTMSARINDELLPAIKNIKSDKPSINCGTCHHGIAPPGQWADGLGRTARRAWGASLVLDVDRIHRARAGSPRVRGLIFCTNSIDGSPDHLWP